MSFVHEKAREYIAKILSLPYLSKKTVFIADLVFIAGVFTVSYFLCYILALKPVYPKPFIGKLILSVISHGLFFILFATYREVLRYSSFKDTLRIFLSLLSANIVLLVILLSVYAEHTFSLVLVFINFVLGFSAILLGRMTIRLFFDYVKKIHAGKKDKPLLIFGTNPTHISLAKMIQDNEYLPYSIAGFISSGTSKPNQKIMNCPIYSKTDFLTHASCFKHIRALLIISEELKPSEKKSLVEKCMEYKIELLSAPSLDDWKTQEKKNRKIKKFRIEQLLGRPPREIDKELIGSNLTGKTILITGAAGSIGSEIVRQLCRFNVKMLLLCDIAETPLHQLNLELSSSLYPPVKKVLLVSDVRNYDRMKSIFEQYRPQYVYHAAAYKHVPLMEDQPSEAVLANVVGTKNVADLAVDYRAECFVMISTDKAVNPSSVMGASKRIAEIYIQYLVHHQAERKVKNPVRFITTRFGNVLGSNGSVIPLFEKQIEAGGPITVTHPDIIRYFMTITEACNLVLEAGYLGQGGEIFVFDMGESVKIKDMAEDMIRLSDLVPYKDIDIVYTGLRPGEKLFEELLYAGDEKLPTRHDNIMISKVTESDYEEVLPMLFQLIAMAGHCDDPMEIVMLMKRIAPEFVSLNSKYGVLDDIIRNESKIYAFV